MIGASSAVDTTTTPVVVLATGGTILTSSHAGLVDTDVDELVRMIGTDAPVRSEGLMAKPGRDLTVADMVTIVRTARDIAESGSAVVVVHGTDTLEETAYLLALTVPPQYPVVVTGSMRRADDLGADGPANLAAAVAVASSGLTCGMGPVVVLNDEIHSAFWARKGHSSSPSTFTSAPAGPLGAVVEGRVDMWMTPIGTCYVDHPQTMVHRVPVLHVTAGMTVDLLPDHEALDGVVLAGTGGGHVPSVLLDWIDVLLKDHKPVVVATRVGEGRTLTDTYSGPGSERDLLARGCLGAGYLSAVKSRLRLLMVLAAGIAPGGAFPQPYRQ